MPAEPKIYHIVHIDRLPSIIADGGLRCDAEIVRRGAPGTTIGMNSIKQRRLNELTLTSHPDLYVGDCVPFYFCPRSVMLYLIHRNNHRELEYHGGQGPIIHLEADLRQTVAWADDHNQRWAFTTANAGSNYFDDYSNLAQLDKIDWDAVQAKRWSGGGVPESVKEGKQAEFLLEHSFPWELVSRIGVQSQPTYDKVLDVLGAATHRPTVERKREWYY
jgi:hypothetical protein